MNTQPNRVAPKLVGFRGGLGVGKSTAAAFLVENYGFTRIAFADALKIECYDFMTGETPPPASIPETITNAAFGLARKDDLAPHDGRLSDLGKIAYVSSNKDILRPLIQWWGTDYRREQNVNYWTGRLASRHRAVMRQGGRTVIDDVRFENEMQRVVDLGGVLVFLSTPDEARATRLRERDGIVNVGIAGHASESLANDIEDPRNRSIIENDGSVDHLHDNLRALVSVLGFGSIVASERGLA